MEAFLRVSRDSFAANWKESASLQYLDKLEDCADYLGLFFPDREQFKLILKFSYQIERWPQPAGAAHEIGLGRPAKMSLLGVRGSRLRASLFLLS